MRYRLLRFVPAALVCVALSGQPQEPRFEVASIKPGTPLNQPGRFESVRGGPGTTDPGMFTCRNCSLAGLISQAYGPLQFGQFVPLQWLGTARFDIAAKVPAGASREQFRIMLRNLLIERFKVAVHRDLRPLSVYELTVAKDGPKFQATAANNDEPPDMDDVGRPKVALDGSFVLPRGIQDMFGMVGEVGHGEINLEGKPISQLTAILAVQYRMPVLDKTGLAGTYDIKLSVKWEGRDLDARQASLQEALRSQLGLLLHQNKGAVSVLIVDRAEKVPVEN
ncbi:MAG TPA: TIGR03435 family protein [Verrucomicrobiae bacterium]|nr:TIGR03435 family protein [Verrucomicrobiae bacterium]